MKCLNTWASVLLAIIASVLIGGCIVDASLGTTSYRIGELMDKERRTDGDGDVMFYLHFLVDGSDEVKVKVKRAAYNGIHVHDQAVVGTRRGRWTGIPYGSWIDNRSIPDKDLPVEGK